MHNLCVYPLLLLVFDLNGRNLLLKRLNCRESSQACSQLTGYLVQERFRDDEW
jgi:hypothetical protein